MVKVILENLALCEDCTIIAVNDDWSGLDYHYSGEELVNREQAINKGLNDLAQLGYLTHDGSQEGDEFSTWKCDCCGTWLAGRRDFFNIIK